MRSLATLLLAAVLPVLGACDLYFHNGGDDVCRYPTEGDIAPADERRDPQTGQCSYFGGYPCDEACGPCAEVAIAEPDWGSCYSQCDGLAADACMATTGCFASFLGDPTNDGGYQFWGCWQTAPSGPIQGGGCAGLDAHECSRHDDCSALYDLGLARRSEVVAQFAACRAETSSCESADCGPDTHCEEHCTGTSCQPVCVPDVSSCNLIDCGPGYECVEVCSDGTNGGCGSCEAQCVAATQCEALPTEGVCSQRTDCTPVYQGDDCTCYPGYCECNILTYDHCETK